MDNTRLEKRPFVTRHKKAIIAASIVFLLAFLGNYYISKSTEKKPAATSSVIDALNASDTSAVTATGPVARVNGVEISRNDYQNAAK